MEKKILLFCAKGFETMEFSVFIDIFGYEVKYIYLELLNTKTSNFYYLRSPDPPL